MVFGSNFLGVRDSGASWREKRKQKMKSLDFASLFIDPQCKKSSYFGLIAALLLCLTYFIGSSLIAPIHNEKISLWGVGDTLNTFKLNKPFNKCKSQCRPHGSEALPEGIISRTSNLELMPLWGYTKKNKTDSSNLFAAAVGIKQKDLVNKMVTKFLSSNFVVILFHYDGNVDKWKSFEWSDNAIHVSAMNQTKWWFAKRFLHPDIISEYSYIFLWDEDLGVENFHPARYISIVQSEGLEISQPALDRAKSVEVHHQITLRGRRSTVHRRIYKQGKVVCDSSSKAPPCTGWVEMMAPVFSRAAWRCVWHMIQNDLIHAWGLDYELGYCAQGDRTKNVGVVDAEYIIHLGRPTLGATNEDETSSSAKDQLIENATSTEISTPPLSRPLPKDHPRFQVRKQSSAELLIFKHRWKKAMDEDKCWVDPFQ